MASKTRIFLNLHFSIGAALMVLFLSGFFVTLLGKEYYFGLIGLGVILFPLIGIGALYNEVREEKLRFQPYYFIALGITITVMVADIIYGMFIVVAITAIFTICLWSIVLALDDHVREYLGRTSIILSRGCLVFAVIFLYFYTIDVPARAISAGIIVNLDGMFDIIAGISWIGLFVFILIVSRYRIGGLMTFGVVAYFYTYPAQEIVSRINQTPPEYLPVLVVMILITIVLSVNTGLGVGRSISETIVLVKHGRSGFFGPWFAAFIKNPRYLRVTADNAKPFTPAEKHVMVKGIAIILVMTLVILPGFLSYFNAYKIPIQITPRNDYSVKFNFWASSNLDAYPIVTRVELSNYKANLDLTFGQITTQSAKTLVEFETAMPGITYRVTINPSTIAKLLDYVKNATLILLAYMDNGTLHHWRGFCFDIEGPGYSDLGCNGSIDEEIAIWTSVFDWVGNKTIMGKPIEMECVSSSTDPVDMAFDGDIDMQQYNRQVDAVPDRFTTYAPMIYRCGYEGTKPYGSPMNPLRPWHTSYSVYTNLATLGSRVPVDRMGVYLGILNCSCYGRDLPQPEPISWGNATGLGNLIRDVLICKSFGIKEVTFFLQFTAIENGYSMGGAFATYGDDFLAIMNDSVNTHPPSSFMIYYNKDDGNLDQTFAQDWILDFARLPGILEVLSMACVAVLAMVVLAWMQQRKKL
ncbi:MAG TPA: hypothetical protein VKM55_02760 [Candidatus Lokiarchaeia archaeon]|nr:hypothetical protein [Candidatus Lokiarchaeia archaeon]